MRLDNSTGGDYENISYFAMHSRTVVPVSTLQFDQLTVAAIVARVVLFLMLLPRVN